MQFRFPAAIAAFAAVAALALTAPSTLEAQAAAGTKIGFVDSRAIMEQAPGRDAAQQAFEREAAQWRGQVQKMQDSLQSLVSGYQRDESKMTATQKETRANTIRTTEEQFGQRTQQLNEQAQKRQQELMQPILDGVKTVLEEVRAAEGYGLVLDVAAGPMVVAADKSLDLTQKVVARLKQRPAPQIGRAAPPAAAPASGAPVARPSGAARPTNTPPQN